MKKFLAPVFLPSIALGTGALGLLLRIWHTASGLDGKGLPIDGHPAQILLWILTAAVTVAVFLLTRQLGGRRRYQENFPADTLSAVGIAVGAAGLCLWSVVTLLTRPQGIDAVCAAMGFASAAMLGFSAWCRYQGKRPVATVHTVVSLFLMLRLVAFYRNWSADPILLDYCFQLLANVCLMLASYQRAAFAARMGRRYSYTFFAIMSVYFCSLSLVSVADILFFLPLAVWMITDHCSLKTEENKCSCQDT